MLLVDTGPSSCEEQQHQPDSRAGLACAAAQASSQQRHLNTRSLHTIALSLSEAPTASLQCRSCFLTAHCSCCTATAIANMTHNVYTHVSSIHSGWLSCTQNTCVYCLLQAWAALQLSRARSTSRGLWAATVVWLCMLLLLEVLLSGTATLLRNSLGQPPSLHPQLPWCSWVAVVSAAVGHACCRAQRSVSARASQLPLAVTRGRLICASLHAAERP
jgi:hypothetical protein